MFRVINYDLIKARAKVKGPPFQNMKKVSFSEGER